MDSVPLQPVTLLLLTFPNSRLGAYICTHSSPQPFFPAFRTASEVWYTPEIPDLTPLEIEV